MRDRVLNAGEELELVLSNGIREVEEECNIPKPRLPKTAP